MLSVPFALVGGVWLMWWLGFNMSVAVAVGFIALAGVAAETGVVMLIYLDQALNEIRAERDGRRPRLNARGSAAGDHAGAVERVRPKMMTVVAIMAGLLPILWSTGTGSEVMQRIAVPMIGGMVSSTLLTLIVIPAIYAWSRVGAWHPESRPYSVTSLVKRDSDADQIRSHMSAMRLSVYRADADRCLPVLLHLQRLRTEAQAVGRRLLRVLFVRIRAAHQSRKAGEVRVARDDGSDIFH